MNEQEFLSLAETMLEGLFARFEVADSRGALEAELSDESLLLTLDTAKQYVINRHTPMRQMWLSSPVSGGLHFSWEEGDWKLKDGRTLTEILESELAEYMS